jgi:hypothetical protein
MLPISSLIGAIRLQASDEDEPRNELLARCLRAHLALPWLDASAQIQEAIRACLAMATSVIQLAPDCCSLRQDIERAFGGGAGSTSAEIELAQALLQSSEELVGLRRLPNAEDCRAIVELAPAFFGGPRWLECPRLSRAARMGFVHGAAIAAASRLFFDARATEPCNASSLARHAQSLESLAHADWPPLSDAQELARFDDRLGTPGSWPISVAARERIAAFEKSELQNECGQPTTQPQRPNRL